ncbi:MAG: ABC transporter ATP-binding protein [Solirubrobacterales bacterium]|nr:ABC transporter ATP-binding protein [Solirubrobacterales bacterium]MBV9471597.1 ABC transporter ATP-binding protein [Solirubrobacterales bacterium]MBV9837830.1 ABC transporter ATP-binding protein [Solirubrobacterales bacterium]
MSRAIEVSGLGKEYRISHEARSINPTLRDALVDLFQRPLSRLTGRQGPSHEQFWALRDLSFTVEEGDVLGIIGRNGSGKSTLLKILSRIVDPTEGEVRIRGRVASLLEVGTGFHVELTGRENIYLNGAILGMTGREINRKFDEIVEFSEIEQFLDTPVKFYSSGMYVRLAFAVAAHLDPDVLIVDEVLAVGDAAFQRKCLGKMGEVAGTGRTVLFVSHGMATIEQLCNKAILLVHGVSEHGIEDVRTAVDRYLERQTESEVHYPTGPVRRLGVRQVGDRIDISLDYELKEPLNPPLLGVVISDHAGRPITGGDPQVLRQPRIGARLSGTITASLIEPKLLDGTYRLSVWFGDDWEHIFVEEQCLAFDVAGMSSSHQAASTVGPVQPKCIWHFDEPGQAAVYAASSRGRRER